MLKNVYNWTSYGQKHFESITRFYEGYWLSRFNFIKKCQLSSLIISNQITRNEALKIVKKPPLNKLESYNDYNYVINKLNLSKEEMKEIENSKKKYYYDYKNFIVY